MIRTPRPQLMDFQSKNVEAFADFIIERDTIRGKRAQGQSKPWTNDRILRDYRFCNVRREDDTVTKWISTNWREPNRDNVDNWFAMAVARWVNWPDTLAAVGYPVPWSAKNFIRTLEKRKALGEKVWTGAYMIGTQGNAMDKTKFIAEGVLQPLWDDRKNLRPRAGDTLASFAQRIIDVKNQGRFMVGQIVADIKYTDPHLLHAPDWATWAVSGPGSRRGLNRVLGRDKDTSWGEVTFLAMLTELRRQTLELLPPWVGLLHAQDIQNCLCEFDKYERVRKGEGRPRSLYPGRA